MTDNKSGTAGPVQAPQPGSETAQSPCGLTQRGTEAAAHPALGEFPPKPTDLTCRRALPVEMSLMNNHRIIKVGKDL